MSLKTKKNKRSQLRRHFTTAANEVDQLLGREERSAAEEEQLKRAFMQLTDKAERLEAADAEVLDAMSQEEEVDEERDREFDEQEAYRERWLNLRMTLQTTPAGNQQTVPGAQGKTSEEKRNFKLPKLELVKFDGNVKNWIAFWGQFKKIHDDPRLDSEDKFQYLVQATTPGSSARELVESFPPSAANYNKAIDQLKARFAKDEFLIEVYVRELLQLVLNQTLKRQTMALSSLFDKLETQLRALESLGVTRDRFAAMLYPLVESALPEAVLKAWERHRTQAAAVDRTPSGTDKNYLQLLLDFVRAEVESEERLQLAKASFSCGGDRDTKEAKPSRARQAATSTGPTAATIVATTENKAGPTSSTRLWRWLAFVGCLCVACHGVAHMDVVHSWRHADFAFPNAVARDAMVRTGRFKPENIALIDVDVWQGGTPSQKIFVTMPRLKAGTPATLATVTPGGSLEPYPDWSAHREGNCEGITSVFRIEVDECGRLWVLDTGTVNIFENPKMICPPQILVYNLHNDKLMGRYIFPDDVVDSKSLLVTIAVDTRGSKCSDTFAYVADVTGYRLIVFDANRQRSWRVNNNYFYPYPLHGSYDINGVRFDLMDGVLGLAVGPLVGGDRRLYFHSLASVRESWVATSIIRNRTTFTVGDKAPRSFHVSQHTRPSQSAAEAMSPSGVLFFGLLSQNSIVCWNSRLPYARENFVTVAQNNETLQFASGLKYRNNQVWVLASKLQNFIKGLVKPDQNNYHIVRGRSGNDWELTVGTSCDQTPPHQGRPTNQPFTFQQFKQQPTSGYNPFIFSN